MPIDDLQDNEVGYGSEAGRIRLGVKVQSKSGKEVPMETDYFVLKDAPDLIPFYGEQPKELLVYLPYKERDQNLIAYYRLFNGAGLQLCQGTGSHIEWAVDPGETGEVVIRNGKAITDYMEQDGVKRLPGDVVACSGKDCKTAPLYPRCLNCGRRMMLFLLIRDPRQPKSVVNDRLAYYVLQTTGAENIQGLTRSLNLYADLAASRGKSLAGIPLILKRYPKQTTAKIKENGVTKRIRTTKSFLAFEADPRWLAYAAPGLPAGALGVDVDQFLLDSGDDGVIEGDVIPEEEMYTPDLPQITQELASKIADIEAAKDNVPANMGEMHTILSQMYGNGYSADNMLRAIRQRLGMNRNERLEADKRTWAVACDLMIERYTGEHE